MTKLLERVPYACLNGAYAVRVLDGCTAACAFCYRRGHGSDAPPSTVTLAENVIDRITDELAARPRTAARVSHVVIDSEVDGLPSDLQVQDTLFRLFRTLLDRKIGLSFFTKGVITRRFVDLFATNRGRIRARVGLAAHDPALAALLEPSAAPPVERLTTIDTLAGLEALSDVRIDPILPGLTDTDEAITRALGALAQAGARRAVLSYVHLRPAIRELLDRVVPADARRLLDDTYRTQPWVGVGAATEVKLLPRTYREEGYLRFRQLAQRFGVEIAICQCKNPDLSGDSCGTGEARLFTAEARHIAHEPTQPALFPC